MHETIGVEQIKNKIMADSKVLCEKIIRDAEREAGNIIEKAEKEAFQKVSIMIEKAKEEAARIGERMKAVAQLEERKRELKGCQNALDQAFKLSLERIASMPDDRYASFIEKVLLKAVSEGKGEIVFNQRDKERLGKKFVSEINKKLKSSGKNSEIVLSGDTLNSRGGFVLKYGDMEVNCTLETIMNMARPALELDVAAILFD